MTHQCSICLKEFDFVSKLRRHQLTHSGQRPFTCYICLKSFRQSAHLKGHLKSHSKLSQVSLILSQAVNSPIPYSRTEESDDQHVGAQLSEEPDVREGLAWYSSLQMSNESEPAHQNDGVYEQKHVQHSVNSTESGAEEHLREMFKTEDEEKPTKMSSRHQCAVCLKYFSAPSKLKRHVLIHGGVRPFCCEFCPKAFRQLAHLKVHLSTHLSQKAIPRNTVCQNPSHPDDAMNTSVSCSKPSSSQWTEEAGEPEKELKEPGNVNTESEIMEGVNAAEIWTQSKVWHECPVCQKCFSAPSKLRRHCLIHTGQRPFQCSLCRHAFRQRSHLKAHLSVHAAPRQKRPSSLQIRRAAQMQSCNGRTSTDRLKRFVHVSVVRKFRCTKQKPKTSGEHLSLLPATGSQTEVNTSGHGAVMSSQVQELERRHDYSCSLCSKHFSAPSKLQRHILIHTGQRPFRCSVCCRGFKQKSHLKVHKCKGGASQGTFLSSISEVSLGGSNGSRSTVSMSRETFSGMGDVCSPNVGGVSKHVQENNDLTSHSYKAMSTSLHEADQSKESGYQCTVCFKMFDFPSKLSRHLLIHMDTKPFKCSICNRSFRQLCHLQSHTKVHMVRNNVLTQGTQKNKTESSITETAEMFNKTKHCTRESGKVLVRQDPHSDHQNMNLINNSSWSHSVTMEETTLNTESTSSPAEVYEGEDSYKQIKRNVNQCIFCLKSFNFPSKLARHLLIHTGIRPHQCHACGKSFKQLSHLQCHQWIHNRKDQSELKASVNQMIITSDGTSLADDLDLHQEISEGLTLVDEGQAGITVQFHHQKCSSDSGQSESKVKSETDLLGERTTFNHVSGPFCTDRTPSTVFYEGLDQQTEKLERINLKLSLNRTCEGHPSDGERTTISPGWDNMDQQVLVEMRGPGPSAQKLERIQSFSFPFSVSEDSHQSSPPITETRKLNHHHQDSQKVRGHKHFTEPPNDLPICPSCSQCFDSLEKLKTHICPVLGPKSNPWKTYQCAVCFKSFEAPSKLKRHYVIHTGQRPYHCNMCGKDFTQSSHLKTHMLSHR